MSFCLFLLLFVNLAFIVESNCLSAYLIQKMLQAIPTFVIVKHQYLMFKNDIFIFQQIDILWHNVRKQRNINKTKFTFLFVCQILITYKFVFPLTFFSFRW